MAFEDILGQVLERAGSGGGQAGAAGGLDDLLGQLDRGRASSGGGTAAAAGMAGIAGALAPLIAGFLRDGGLEKLLANFRSAGLGEQAQSWVGTGANEPVSGAQVGEALSSDQIHAVAQQLGISHEQASAVLAGVIPGVVDEVTPEGHVPTTEELAAQLGG